MAKRHISPYQTKEAPWLMLSQKQDLRLLQPSLYTNHTVSFPVMLPNSKLGVIYLNEQALR